MAVGHWQVSARWYAIALVTGLVLGRWAQYLTEGSPVVKGQPAVVIIILLAFAVSVLLWLLTPGSLPGDHRGTTLLVLLGVAWVVKVGLAYLHADLFYHFAWIYLPVLAMLWWKPLSLSDWAATFRVLGWLLVVMLLASLLLEVAGTITPPDRTEALIDFEGQNYWLPLSDMLGIEGRWPGPFGHNGDTGAVAALLVVMGFGLRGRSGPAFVVAGVLVLLLTASRTATIAALAGAGLIVLFGDFPVFRRLSFRWRLAILGGGLVVVVVAMIGQSSNLTGRDVIWPAFLDLWRESPWTGVGAMGIAENGGLTQRFFHAHNFFLDDLVRNGVIGAATQFAALGYGALLMVRAVGRGLVLPAGLLIAYLILGVAQVPNEWIQLSTFSMLLIGGSLWSAQQLATPKQVGPTEGSPIPRQS